jgi:16S rRNA (guanine(966)-N(2))-methyltransferase RsmD
MKSIPGKSHALRITGGMLKGITINVPPGVIRPAMDKMRESLFSVLGDLSDSSFLDLFSGSGIIVLEAASRGANGLEAVEADSKKLKTLIANCSVSPVHIKCHLISAELFINRSTHSFDYIFCDPPFAYRYKKDLIERIASSCLMNNTSLLMIHYPKKEKIFLQVKANNLFLQDSRFYGNSIINFYKKE